MVYASIMYGGQLFFTYRHAISAFGWIGDNATIEKQGADKLLAAFKR